jgi:serine/threonine protein kinase
VLISPDGRIKLADFGLARFFQAPPRPLIDDQTVVTRWYRSPELILGARHYTPAVDMWSLGALFGELIMLTPLFVGSKEEPDGIAKDQLLRIFERLGRPDTTVWPTLIEMPLWEQATQWTAELAACPAPAEGAARLQDMLTRRMMVPGRKVAPAECAAAVKVMLHMLHFDPSQRAMCKNAKEFPFFANVNPAQLRGNVLAEFGSSWQSFYVGNSQRGNASVNSSAPQ